MNSKKTPDSTATQQPGSDSSNPWITLSSETRYDNPWIRVVHHDVENPPGNPGIYGTVHFKNTAIGIVPLDDANNTWLVGQYRYPLQQYSWEIPEGGGDASSSSLDAAKRELLEETGIEAATWTEIMQLHLSNSVSDECAVVYVAKDLSYGTAQPEETEQLVVRKLPFEEALAMAMNGEITDGLAVCALLKTARLLDQGKL